MVSKFLEIIQMILISNCLRQEIKERLDVPGIYRSGAVGHVGETVVSKRALVPPNTSPGTISRLKLNLKFSRNQKYLNNTEHRELMLLPEV